MHDCEHLPDAGLGSGGSPDRCRTTNFVGGIGGDHFIRFDVNFCNPGQSICHTGCIKIYPVSHITLLPPMKAPDQFAFKAQN
jgi:hypothetical protein